jgi:ParB family chromosome partitioning protein
VARKNPFAHVLDDTPAPVDQSVIDYPIRGASRSLISSIDEIASRANSLLEGETVVELDPAVIDPSFVRDRLETDDAGFDDLVEAIRVRGQDTPILVRPHPTATGRYMVVFGHRRVRAVSALGRKVLAVVKNLEDREHVVAQGQENSARQNLSFIERARFAASLTSLRLDEDGAVALAALTIDRATLSKMLSVATIPSNVLDSIGAARGIGRDRWYELKLLLDNPALLASAQSFVQQPGQGGDDRFNALIAHLKAARATKRSSAGGLKRTWKPDDGALSAQIVSAGKRFNLVLTGKGTEARAFGDYVSENLDRLYEAFKQTTEPTHQGG